MLHLSIYIPSKKSSAQVGVWVNSVSTRNGYIKCYISSIKEIIMQQCDAFQTVIQDSLTKPSAFKASRSHPSKMVKLELMLMKHYAPNRCLYIKVAKLRTGVGSAEMSHLQNRCLKISG